MAKELPYFKFYINEWNNGDISLENYKIQGIFLNICIYYWSKDCELTLQNLKKKFRGLEQQIDYLIASEIIKIDGENIAIHFLNEQIQSKEVQKIANTINGMKGGRPKQIDNQNKSEEKPNGLIFANQNITNIKKRKEKYIIEDNIKEAFDDFLLMRVRIKKPATEKAINLLIQKLKILAPENFELQIKILEQSIVNSWQDLYPLKINSNGTKNGQNPRPIGIEPPKNITGYGKL